MADEENTPAADDEMDMAAAMEGNPEMGEASAPNFNEMETTGQTEEVDKDINAIMDIPVQISAVLGKSTMQVNQLLKLGRGAVIDLDRKVGEAIDIYVNNRLVARGEVIVMDDRLGVTMTEIVKSDRPQ